MTRWFGASWPVRRSRASWLRERARGPLTIDETGLDDLASDVPQEVFVGVSEVPEIVEDRKGARGRWDLTTSGNWGRRRGALRSADVVRRFNPHGGSEGVGRRMVYTPYRRTSSCAEDLRWHSEKLACRAHRWTGRSSALTPG